MRKAKEPTLTQLRLLVVVRRAHSLCGAARRLGISQPAVSQRARDLEQRCALELFDRGIYTTSLTADGKRVVAQAERVLREYDRLMSLIAELARRRNTEQPAMP
jgi:DNA-binding transcriptional LysR family regulator